MSASERQPLLAAAARTAKPATKGVNPYWSPQGKKWLKKSAGQRRTLSQSYLDTSGGSASDIAVDDDSVDGAADADDRELKEGKKASLREQWSYFLDATTWGRWWQVFDAALNIAFVLLFIYLTTYITAPPGGGGSRPPPPPDHLLLFDMLLAFALLLQWLPRVYLSLDPYAEIFTWFTFMTVLATFPVFWAYAETDDRNMDYMDANRVLAFMYPFRFWRMHLSAMRVLAPSKTVALNVSPITQKALKLGLSIFNTLLTVTAWVHICLYIIQKYYTLSFFDVLYTIFVSSTSGLSTQIIPDNPFSRLVIMYVMVVGAIHVPTNLAELLSLIRNKSKYDKPYSGSNSSHVLIVGNFEIPSLRDFLWEFFCEDHGPKTMTAQVVLLNESEPSEELESLLSDPMYLTRVRYVKGSPLSFRCLHRAKAHTAKACFVLASRFSGRPAIEEDAETVMTALAIKKFYRKANIFAQVISPGSKMHFQILSDHLLCIDEFKLGMLAQNCLAPGFSTMLYLLTTSIPAATKKELKTKAKFAPWIDEYADGAEMEIYAVRLSHIYAGMSFPEVAERIYLTHSAIIFAVGFQKDPQDTEPFIVMNPQDYVFNGGETAYLITTQSKVADTIGAEGVVFSSVPSFEEQVPDVQADVESATDGGCSSVNHGEARGESATSSSSTMQGSPDQSIATDELITFGTKHRSTTMLDAEPTAHASKTTSSLPSNVCDHILICTLEPSFPQNLAFFIAPYRHKERKSIVILCPEGPDDETWSKLAAFRDVHFVIGTPLHRKDLQRAKVEKASRAVILANALEQNIASRAADSQALLAILNIQALTTLVASDAASPTGSSRPEIFTMVEFIHPENAKFIGNGEKYYRDGVQGHNLMPCFVGGHVFFNAMFSSLLCQTYYNPHLLHVLKHFIFNGTHSLPASTPLARPSWLPSFPFQSSLPHEPTDPDLPYQTHSNLHQIAVPAEYVNSTYASLWVWLLRRKVLALGLYRRTVESGLWVKYVVVNPGHAVRLREDDRVFVFMAGNGVVE
ncbi:hypothetical protein HDU85_000508 [Gaertneriomyces sp. JEL0708]|nr:hypothetical protein HDU85_000508 [Gaertneriomyces sp. JEL0708]